MEGFLTLPTHRPGFDIFFWINSWEIRYIQEPVALKLLPYFYMAYISFQSFTLKYP